MKDTDPPTVEGLPDAGGLNIDYQDVLAFEPTDEQLRMIRADCKRVADSVRRHLTHEFTVTPRIDRTSEGLQGLIVVEFPTGDAIGPAIPITADMFEGATESNWEGPIPPEEIETLSREITTATVTRWAEVLDRIEGEQALPAS